MNMVKFLLISPLIALGLSVMFTASSWAQTVPPGNEVPLPELPPTIEDLDPETDPETQPDSPNGFMDLFPDGAPRAIETEDVKPDLPDYSRLTKTAERKVRLDKLFERIKVEEDPENASLIAEEIWAIWLDSGSASVNLLLRRGTAAQKRGDVTLARRMFDHVTSLLPDYAEGWSRSARLALEEKDYSRALTETTEALIREPRHFYALWTLGNIFERLERGAQALAAYEEAHALYPELKPVKERMDLLRGRVEGPVL